MEPLAELSIGVDVSQPYFASVYLRSPTTLSGICSRLRQCQSVGCVEWSTV